MDYVIEKTLDKDLSDYIHSLENITGEEAYNKYGLKFDETVVETFKFENGFETDVKLVIADDDQYNWTEAVLFDEHGNEKCCSEWADDFFGEWYLEDFDGNTYTVILDDGTGKYKGQVNG